MKQEDKELLLKDLCARLPYGVKCKYYDCCEGAYDEGTIRGFERHEYMEIDGVCIHVEEVKPYLFPLSSMTEEQKNQLTEIWDADMNKALDYAISGEEGLSDLFKLSAAKKVINWFIKNHFDFQGLIPKELAIDCTNLNVY